MGGISIIVALGWYSISLDSFLTWCNNALYIVFIVFMVLAATDERKANGGYITFAEALKAAFLAYIVGGLIYFLFFHILQTVIDPSIPELTKEKALETMDMWEGIMSEEQLEQTRETIEEQSFVPTIGSTLLGYLLTVIVSFFFALIIAAIVKRKKPLEMA